MKNNTLFLVLGSVTLSIAATGCGRSVHEYAKAASKELGIPVTVKTDDTDVCAEKQMYQIYADYKSLTKEERLGARRVLRERYKSVVIQPSKTTARVTGERTVLNLVGGKDGIVLRASKSIAEAIQLEGTAPVTEVEKAEALGITTQMGVDTSVRSAYAILSEDLYRVIDKRADPTFERGLQAGAILPMGQTNAPLIDCGKLARLRELL